MDNINKCLTCAHPGCQWPNVCHVASVSTNILMPGILPAQQHALMLPSKQWTVWWLGMSSTFSGFHLKAKGKHEWKNELTEHSTVLCSQRNNNLVHKPNYMNAVLVLIRKKCVVVHMVLTHTHVNSRLKKWSQLAQTVDVPTQLVQIKAWQKRRCKYHIDKLCSNNTMQL